MLSNAERICSELKPLIGLGLSISQRAADMRIFGFGSLRQHRKGTVGEFALHIQCPWRLEGPEGIITGRADLYEPAEEPDESFDWDSWDYQKDGNRQDKRVADLLRGSDLRTRSPVNVTESLIVEAIDADELCGVAITFSVGYRLILFPDSSKGEHWRFFRPGADLPHFVVSGLGIEEFE